MNIYEKFDLIESKYYDRFTTYLTDLLCSKSKREFHKILNERKRLSWEFEKIYNTLVIIVDDAAAKEKIREIISYEFPIGVPSHREELIEELVQIGVKRQRAVDMRCSSTTLAAIHKVNKVTEGMCRQKNRQIRALTFLRSWGEISTSLEYKIYWDLFLSKHLKKYGDDHDHRDVPESRFYWFHFEHDKAVSKISDMHEDHCGTHTHADDLGAAIAHTDISSVSENELKNMIGLSIEIKLEFYKQFE